MIVKKIKNNWWIIQVKRAGEKRATFFGFSYRAAVTRAVDWMEAQGVAYNELEAA